MIATAYAARYPTRGVVNVDQSLRVGPLPAEMIAAVRGEGFADFVRTLFAQLYGELGPALAADIERRRVLDQEVFSGFWTPLLDWDAGTRIPGAVTERTPTRTHYPHLAQPQRFAARVHQFFS